jgi:hypothetical protein
VRAFRYRSNTNSDGKPWQHIHMPGLELSEEFVVLSDETPVIHRLVAGNGPAVVECARALRYGGRALKGRLARPFSAVSWNTTLSNP